MLAATSARAQVPMGNTYPASSEWSTFGDSIMSGGGGMSYLPARPIAFTASTAAGSPVLTTVSSTAGLQVGAYVYGPGVPTATISAISGSTVTLSSNATATGVGVAMAAQALIVSGLQSGAQQNSPLGWLDALTGNALSWTAAAGYGGNLGGLYNVTVIAGGAGYGASSSWSVSGPNNSPPNQAGPFNCAAVSGTILSCTMPSPAGSGYFQTPTVNCTSGCGSGAVLNLRLGGSGTFGNPGDTTAGILARVPDVCAAHPAWVLMDGGTNDMGAGGASAAANAAGAIANLTTITTRLRACGVRAALFKVTPRSSWLGLSGYSIAQAQAGIARINRAIERLGSASYSPTPSLVVIDAGRYITDAGNAANPGYALPGLLSDGLHPGIGAAFWMAVAAKQALGPYLQPNPPAIFGQDDVYDATTNVTGNLLGTQGLMLGTGGGTGPCSGAVATGWSIFTQGSGDTLTCSTAIENPRTDATSGQRQVVTLTATNTGATIAPEVLTMQVTVPSSSNVVAGDRLEASCEMSLSNYVNVDRIGIALGELNFSLGAGYNQYAYGLDGPSYAGVVLPPYTKVAGMALQGILPGFVRGEADGAFDIAVKTKVPLPAQAGAGAVYNLYVEIGFEASAAETGTQATLKISNCAVRKIL